MDASADVCGDGPDEEEDESRRGGGADDRNTQEPEQEAGGPRGLERGEPRKPGLRETHIIAEFARRRPGWRVDMRQAAWSEPSAGLTDGDADAALVRMPFPGQDALRTEVLFSEPRWVALPAGHPLAVREVIPFRELWDEPFVAAPPGSGRWRDYWLDTDEREGHPVRIGAVTDRPDDWLSAIANGYGTALAPASAARFYARPGIVYRPVSGIGPSQVGVAWARADDTDPVVQDFVRCCLDNRPRPADVTG